MDLIQRVKQKALNALSSAIPPLAIGNVVNQASQAVQRLQPQIQPTIDRVTNELNNQNRNTVNLIHQGVLPSQILPSRAVQTDLQPQIDFVKQTLNKIPANITPLTDILNRVSGIKVGDLLNSGVNMFTGGAYSPEEQSFFKKRNLLNPTFSPGELEAGKNLGIQDMLAVGGITSSPKASALDDVLKGTNAVKIPKAKTKMLVTPDGVIAKTDVAPKTTASVSKILGQVENVNPQLPKPASQLLLEPPKGGLELATIPKEVAPAKEFKLPNVEVQKSPLKRLVEDIFRSSKGVIKRSGQAGKEIINKINLADNEARATAGPQVESLRVLKKGLTKDQIANFADYVEGRLPIDSEPLAQAVAVWKTISKDIYDRARSSQLDIGLIENYFPHHIIKDVNKNPQAKAVLGKLAERRYGNLELSRQTDLPFEKSLDVLFSYIQDANARISEAKYFGKNDSQLFDLVDQASKQGGDKTQLTKYVEQILGKNQNKTLDNISETIRGAQTVLKLNPKTAIQNLTQGISTALRTDIPTTISSIVKTVSNFEQALSNYVKATGDITGVADLQGSLGNKNFVSKWIKLIGMQGTEKFNRIVAVNAGMDYMKKLVSQAEGGSQAALRELQRLGVDMTNPDALAAGRRVMDETQFSTKPGELPYGWSTAFGKILTQFKSFGFKQTGFLRDQGVRITQEASKGNIKPLINALVAYGVAAPIVGEVVNDLNSLILNKKRDDRNLVERYAQNILAATSFGLFDLIDSATGQYGARGVVGTVAGPTASDIVKVGEVTSNIQSDKDYERNKAYRDIIKTIPLVGQTLSNTLVPNSYVDNYIGPNVGLNAEDKNTYQNLQKNNPQAAELFKKQAQENRPGMLDFLKGSQEPVVPKAGASKEEFKKFKKYVKDNLDNGLVPKKQELSSYLFDNKSANSQSLEERMSVYKKLGSLLSSEDYTDEQKQAFLEASGASKNDSEYFVRASKDADVKLQEILPLVLSESNDSKRLFELMKMRRMVGGKQVLTSEMLSYLNDNGVISDEEKKAISALQYDEVNNKFYFTKSFLKSGKRMTFSQAKQIFKAVKIPSYTMLNSSKEQIISRGDTILKDILNKKANPIKL